jgi:hypothetical protein
MLPHRHLLASYLPTHGSLDYTPCRRGHRRHSASPLFAGTPHPKYVEAVLARGCIDLEENCLALINADVSVAATTADETAPRRRRRWIKTQSMIAQPSCATFFDYSVRLSTDDDVP